jgi:hypothetical protein
MELLNKYICFFFYATVAIGATVAAIVTSNEIEAMFAEEKPAPAPAPAPAEEPTAE